MAGDGEGEETFYDVLGVDPGADSEAVDRAYRERVKESHPDVSDDPEAPREFKRLTTARDVLRDATERARYERLGHAAYVRDHVDGGWTPSRSPNGTDRPTGEGNDGQGEEDRGVRPESEAPGTGTGGGTQQWQTATGPYRRVETDLGGTGRPLWRRVAAVARRVGPWALVHAVFILAALATVWFAYSGASYLGLSLPALVGGGLLLAVAVVTSAIHLLTRVYT